MNLDSGDRCRNDHILFAVKQAITAIIRHHDPYFLLGQIYIGDVHGLTAAAIIDNQTVKVCLGHDHAPFHHTARPVAALFRAKGVGIGIIPGIRCDHMDLDIMCLRHRFLFRPLGRLFIRQGVGIICIHGDPHRFLSHIDIRDVRCLLIAAVADYQTIKIDRCFYILANQGAGPGAAANGAIGVDIGARPMLCIDIDLDLFHGLRDHNLRFLIVEGKTAILCHNHPHFILVKVDVKNIACLCAGTIAQYQAFKISRNSDQIIFYHSAGPGAGLLRAIGIGIHTAPGIRCQHMDLDGLRHRNIHRRFLRTTTLIGIFIGDGIGIVRIDAHPNFFLGKVNTGDVCRLAAIAIVYDKAIKDSRQDETAVFRHAAGPGAQRFRPPHIAISRTPITGNGHMDGHIGRAFLDLIAHRQGKLIGIHIQHNVHRFCLCQRKLNIGTGPIQIGFHTGTHIGTAQVQIIPVAVGRELKFIAAGSHVLISDGVHTVRDLGHPVCRTGGVPAVHRTGHCHIVIVHSAHTNRHQTRADCQHHYKRDPLFHNTTSQSYFVLLW